MYAPRNVFDDVAIDHPLADVFWTSTVGASPVTVRVSRGEPTRSGAFTVAVKLPVNSIPITLRVFEARERERHRVASGRQIDDLKLSGPSSPPNELFR